MAKKKKSVADNEVVETVIEAPVEEKVEKEEVKFEEKKPSKKRFFYPPLKIKKN